MAPASFLCAAARPLVSGWTYGDFDLLGPDLVHLG